MILSKLKISTGQFSIGVPDIKITLLTFVRIGIKFFDLIDYERVIINLHLDF